MSPVNLRRWLTLGAPVALFALFFMVLATMMQIAPTSANPTDPELPPPFVGEPATATLQIDNLPRIPLANPQTSIYNFENGIPTGWIVADVPSSGYQWGTEVYTNGAIYTGTASVWAVGAGISGTLLNPISDTYPAGVDTWLIYGPMDLSRVSAASISFEYLLDVENGVTDKVGLFVSTNGSSYAGLVSGVNTASWLQQSYNLSAYLGDSSVWVAFNFNAGGHGNGHKGAFVDNVAISLTPYDKAYMPLVRNDPTATPTQTPTPSPTPSPTAVPNYQDLFAANNTGWDVIRRRNTDDTPNNVIQYVTWQTPTFLEVEVKNSNDYIILSPLVRARANAPYELEVDAKFDNFANGVNDQNKFSLIFDGDYDNSPPSCPNGGFNGCFSSYYAWQIQWRNGNQLYYKLVQVTGHGAGNQPTETIIVGDTTIPKSLADGDRIHRYTIEVVTNNQIKLYINNNLLNTVNLPTTLNNTHNYFGLGLATQTLGNARVRFYGMAMGDGLTTTPPTGGGTGANLFKYEFNSQTDVNTWKSDAQGHSRTLFAATNNQLEWEGGNHARVTVGTADQFVVYSPLQKVSNNDYWIEARLEFVDETDQDALGIVFAADRNEAQTCPNPAMQFQTCFTGYYVVRLVYLTGDRINVRVEKVTRPSGSANPTYTLLGETTLGNSDGITAGGMNTWKIEVDRTTGAIRVNVNSRTNIVSVTDTSYIAQYYFGLLAKTSLGNPSAVGRFDYYYVYEQ